MKATYEIKAIKDGKLTIRYQTLDVYYGVSRDLYDKYEELGYTDIEIRMI